MESPSVARSPRSRENKRLSRIRNSIAQTNSTSASSATSPPTTPPPTTPSRSVASVISAPETILFESQILRAPVQTPWDWHTTPVDAEELNNVLARTDLCSGQPTFVPMNTPNPSTYVSSHCGSTGHSYRELYGPAVPGAREAIEPIDHLVGTASVSAGGEPLPIGDGVPEHSIWRDETEEYFLHGLEKIARLAEDEHKLDPSKSVGEMYSIHIAALLARGPMAFSKETLE